MLDEEREEVATCTSVEMGAVVHVFLEAPFLVDGRV